MMPGIRLLQCPVCRGTRKIETGIKATYCCGREMEEVKGAGVAEEPQEVQVRIIDPKKRK